MTINRITITTKNGTNRGINNIHQLNSIIPVICKVNRNIVSSIPVIICFILTGIRSNIC